MSIEWHLVCSSDKYEKDREKVLNWILVVDFPTKYIFGSSQDKGKHLGIGKEFVNLQNSNCLVSQIGSN